MAFTTTDIVQIREYMASGPEDESPERVLDRLEGYLAGMEFAAESREREQQARSDRAVKAVKTRKARTPKVTAPGNGRAPLRVGTPTDDDDE
jgi:hypothetical protein